MRQDGDLLVVVLEQEQRQPQQEPQVQKTKVTKKKVTKKEKKKEKTKKEEKKEEKKLSWRDAVQAAIERQVDETGSCHFMRQQLIDGELKTIEQATDCSGRTPEMTLSQVLQQLRKLGEVRFGPKPGNYEYLVGQDEEVDESEEAEAEEAQE